MPVSTDTVLEKLLIVRCQTGDGAAYAELIARHQTALFRYLQQSIRDQETVNDLYQDIWFDVFQSLAKLKDTQAFPAWLFRIAHDRVCRFYRKRGMVYQSTSLEEVTDHLGEVVDHDWDYQEVHRAFDQLMPVHREVLVLRYLNEFEYAEIATILGCPVGTVRSRLFHAKKAIRDIFEGEKNHERERAKPSVA
ncbi:MAG TPA: sigma-70 family RNA polymerase sigma factor [Gemmatales bacterium]|nr:sigma-70 family RNA polymerase sigma factor [Gemmatales bacterium]